MAATVQMKDGQSLESLQVSDTEFRHNSLIGVWQNAYVGGSHGMTHSVVTLVSQQSWHA